MKSMKIFRIYIINLPKTLTISRQTSMKKLRNIILETEKGKSQEGLNTSAF
jgi:hypothetical protein